MVRDALPKLSPVDDRYGSSSMNIISRPSPLIYPCDSLASKPLVGNTNSLGLFVSLVRISPLLPACENSFLSALNLDTSEH